MSGIEIRAEKVEGLTIKFDGFDMSVFAAVLAAAVSGGKATSSPAMSEPIFGAVETFSAPVVEVRDMQTNATKLVKSDALCTTAEEILPREVKAVEKVEEKTAEVTLDPVKVDTEVLDKPANPQALKLVSPTKTRKGKTPTIEEMANSCQDAMEILAEVEATGKSLDELVEEDKKIKAERIAQGLPPICPKGYSDGPSGPPASDPEDEFTDEERRGMGLHPYENLHAKAFEPKDPRKFATADDWDDDNPVKGHITDYDKDSPQASWMTNDKDTDDSNGWDTPLAEYMPEMDGSDNPKFADPSPSSDFSFDKLSSWDLPPVI